MKELIEKLIEIERRTSRERGDYNLFAIFLREDSVNKWDVMVSSTWINKGKAEALNYVALNIQSKLTSKELLFISKIVLVDNLNPMLLALNQAFNVEHSSIEVKDSNFFGLQIKHAYIITSRKRVM